MLGRDIVQSHACHADSAQLRNATSSLYSRFLPRASDAGLALATKSPRSRNEQAIVELTLRQQLATYAQKQSKPRLTRLDRALWVALFRLWPGWKDALVIVKPDTMTRREEWRSRG